MLAIPIAHFACLRRSACPPHKALAGGASRRQGMRIAELRSGGFGGRLGKLRFGVIPKKLAGDSGLESISY